MHLFRSPGIDDRTTPRARSYRALRFGPRHAPPVTEPVEVTFTARVVPRPRVQPPQWEDVVASFDRAA